MSDYVLLHREETELDRLRFQHEVWRRETEDLLDRCGIGPRSRVLDLGCGPGLLALDLAARVGPAGRVTAVDASELFTATLRSELSRRRIDHVDVVRADLSDWRPDAGGFDVVLFRWVLMFLPAPERTIGLARDLLAPGGRLGALEYGPFLDIGLDPPAGAFDRIYRAVAELIRGAGGDPDIGLRLPGILRSSGFGSVDERDIRRSDVPGTPLWRWIVETSRNHRHLVDRGLIEAGDLARYETVLEERERGGTGRFVAPTVRAVVARASDGQRGLRRTEGRGA